MLREHGTERAGTSPLDKKYDPGIYHCAGCGQPLFTANTKFNSGTGWPSFYEPLDEAVETQTDRSLFMTRTEVHCQKLRRPSRSRLRRRPAADRAALLHERLRIGL